MLKVDKNQTTSDMIRATNIGWHLENIGCFTLAVVIIIIKITGVTTTNKRHTDVFWKASYVCRSSMHLLNPFRHLILNAKTLEYVKWLVLFLLKVSTWGTCDNDKPDNSLIMDVLDQGMPCGSTSIQKKVCMWNINPQPQWIYYCNRLQ